MMRARFLIAFFALVLTAGAANAQLYRWTDDKGRVNVTDTPPPSSARMVEKQKPRANVVESAQPPFEVAAAMKDFPVVLYTSPSCKEGCEQARNALNSRGVPFREVQVWDDQTNEELKKATGANQVPTLMVGRSVQQGFEQGAFDALLDSARYPRAGAVARRNQAAPKLPDGYVQPAERDPQASKAEPVKPQAEEPRPAGPYAPGAPRQGPRPQQK
jgi:glutaredoxin